MTQALPRLLGAQMECPPGSPRPTSTPPRLVPPPTSRHTSGPVLAAGCPTQSPAAPHTTPAQPPNHWPPVCCSPLTLHCSRVALHCPPTTLPRWPTQALVPHHFRPSQPPYPLASPCPTSPTPLYPNPTPTPLHPTPPPLPPTPLPTGPPPPTHRCTRSCSWLLRSAWSGLPGTGSRRIGPGPAGRTRGGSPHRPGGPRCTAVRPRRVLKYIQVTLLPSTCPWPHP